MSATKPDVVEVPSVPAALTPLDVHNINRLNDALSLSRLVTLVNQACVRHGGEAFEINLDSAPGRVLDRLQEVFTNAGWKVVINRVSTVPKLSMRMASPEEAVYKGPYR